MDRWRMVDGGGPGQVGLVRVDDCSYCPAHPFPRPTPSKAGETATEGQV